MIWRPISQPATKQEFHIVNVYADPDFHNDLERLLPNYKELMRDFLKAKGAKKRQVHEQFEAAAPIFAELAQKYCVLPGDVSFYVAGLHINGNIIKEDPTTNHIELDKQGNFTVHFDYTVTKDDFDDLWRLISEHKQAVYEGKIPRNKLPVYDKLIYAIFRARSGEDKLTFLQIYWLYREDKLKGYDAERGRKTKIFMSAESLEKYYRRNKPTPLTDK